jgi:hypothetical protein
MVQIGPVGSSARRAARWARLSGPVGWLVAVGLQWLRLALPVGRG